MLMLFPLCFFVPILLCLLDQLLVGTTELMQCVMHEQITTVPSFETACEVVAQSKNSKYPPNLLPITASIPADLLTPTLAYLKVSAK